jgi:hypothetical protein
VRAALRVIFVELDASLGSEDAERPPEIDLLALLDEGKEVTAFTAGAEAAPGPALRKDIKRRRLFGVKRAEPAVASPRLLQGRESPDVGDKVDLTFDGVNDVHISIVRAPADGGDACEPA